MDASMGRTTTEIEVSEAMERCRRGDNLISHARVLAQRIKELECEVLEMTAWKDRLEEGRVMTCIYCGRPYPPGTPRSQAAVLDEHVQQCPEHPLAKAKARIAELEAELERKG